MPPKTAIRTVLVFLLLCMAYPLPATAETCEKAVQELNMRLSPKVDQRELIEIVRSLERTGNRQLPPKFVTKEQARKRGWRPGKDLWSIRSLKGASIGGDCFRNREGRLPKKQWREADLDYKGGRRGAKRLVFSRDGQRFVTVDHYRHFVEVPSCR